MITLNSILINKLNMEYIMSVRLLLPDVAKSAVALLFVNMGDNALNAKSAEVFLLLYMGVNALDAKSEEAHLFVNMGYYAVIAKSAE